MSVVVSAVAPGLNAEMYEAITGRVMPGDQLPDGCQLHIAGPVEQGWRVITVWESREAFDRFREQKLLPAIQSSPGARLPRWRSQRSTRSTSWSLARPQAPSSSQGGSTEWAASVTSMPANRP
jgi:hypothetical protein